MCQSIDDGAETALTGDCRIQLTFKGGMKFSKNTCEPPQNLSLMYTIECHVFF